MAREAFIAWLIVILASRLAHSFGSIPIIGNNASLITASLLLYVPIFIFVYKKERIGFVDSSLKDIRNSLKVFLILSLAVFPVVLAGNHFYQSLIWDHSYKPSVDFNWGGFFFYELVLVAFPEEFFFRGYLQERLKKISEKKWNFLKVPIGPSFFVVSFVFALSHSLIQVQWWHLFIFFPGIAFGWLKEKTKAITAPILFHTACNLFAQWVALHYK